MSQFYAVHHVHDGEHEKVHHTAATPLAVVWRLWTAARQLAGWASTRTYAVVLRLLCTLRVLEVRCRPAENLAQHCRNADRTWMQSMSASTVARPSRFGVGGAHAARAQYIRVIAAVWSRRRVCGGCENGFCAECLKKQHIVDTIHRGNETAPRVTPIDCVAPGPVTW